MADASQLFKDDEQDRLGNGYTPDDNSLRNITDINKDEETGYDSSARSGAAEDIANREKSAINNTGNQSGGGKSTGMAGLASAEALGAGLAAINPSLGAIKGGKILSALWGNKTRKRNTIGGGITGLLIAGVMFFIGIASGPLQLIHLAEILGKSFSTSNNESSTRLSRLYKFAKTGQIGDTRVSFLGSKIFGVTIDQLKSLGIEINTNSTGGVKSVGLDTEKLSKNFPELKNMTAPEKLSFLSEQLNIPEANLNFIDGQTKLVGDTTGFKVGETRALLKNFNGLLGDNKLIGAIKNREMTKFFDVPSLFHPLKRIAVNQKNKLTNTHDAKKAAAADEEARQKALEKHVLEDPKLIAAKEDVKSGLSGSKTIVSGALIATAALCIVRSIADKVVIINQAAIVTPSAIKAMDKISLGSQIQNGQDVSADQVGAVVSGLQDSNGKTVWQGQALQVLANNPQAGEDLSYDYKQAFSNKTTAQSIKDTIASPKIGSVDLGAAACSTPGLLIQGAIALGFAFSSVVAAIPTGGASVVAEAANLGRGLIVTAGVVYFLEHQLTNMLVDKAIVPAILSGPVGGNLLAYGSRAAAGMEARSSGGVALTPQQSAILDSQVQSEDQKSFQSKSLYAKVFDIKDYRSLSGKLADSISPSISQNIASILGSFTHLGSIITQAFSSLLPRAAAASTPYDWGFPEYGIPPEILTNSTYENPYNNADKISTTLNADGLDSNGNSLSPYAIKAKVCFGANITKGTAGWDVLFAKVVNPADGDYVSANCTDTGDSTWSRMMLFVFDTKNMKAAACYEGDTQSCQELGQNN